MVCVVRVVGGPIYSLERSAPAIPLYGNVANRLLEDQINLSAKIHLDGKQGRFGRPYFTASGHRPSLVHCLVGPDVRWLVPGLGWSVWTVRWASFALATQDAIFCDFACVYLVFSSYSRLVLLKSIILQNNYGARLVIQICE